MLALPTPAGAADAAPAGGSEHTVTRIVTLASAPATLRAAPSDRKAARGAVERSQQALLDAAKDAGITVSVERRYRHVLNGVAVQVPASRAAQLSSLPGVASVAEPQTYETPERPTPVSQKVVEKAVAQAAGTERSSGGTAPGRETVTATDLTGVPEAHEQGHTGKGVTVGVIDSGVAYDHAALGGGEFPNAKVLGGYDFADEDADPYDDTDAPAAGHGTHVAGIIAGSDEHIQGVAPDATLRSYRVFGTKNPATDAIVLAALDRAAADGVDVVNMSLGATGERSSSVLSRAVTSLADSGTPTVVAVGNGYAGPFNAGAPAVADGAIAVGSTYNTHHPYLAFTLDDGSPAPVPYEASGRGAATPSSGDHPVTPTDGGCEPLPEGSLDGKIALFEPNSSGDPYCRTMDRARNAAAAGAVGALYYTPGRPAEFPGTTCCDRADIPVVGIRGSDAERILAAPSGTRLTWGAYDGTPLAPGTTGLMDHSSSWGPGNELEFKPDVAAPGGHILSALPRGLDRYGVMSGTSMASPHTAGIVALLLEERPDLSNAEVRAALQSTAEPLGMTGEPDRGRQPIAQQGAGRVDAVAALDAISGDRPAAAPSRLALGDLEGRQKLRTVTVTNPTDRAVTYEVGASAAVSAAPPYTSDWKPADAAAKVTVKGPDRVTVASHGSRRVAVAVRQPEGVAQGTLFGGWVEFTRVDGRALNSPEPPGAPEIRVPYLGVAGDFDAVSAVNPSFTEVNTTLDNPALRPGYFDFGKNVPTTVDLTDADTANDKAWVMLSHGFPLHERMRLQVLNARGKVVATPYDERWVSRNSGAGTGMQFYEWDATLADDSAAPAGRYRLRFVFDKALGDAGRSPGTETWTSPEVTLVR